MALCETINQNHWGPVSPLTKYGYSRQATRQLILAIYKLISYSNCVYLEISDIINDEIHIFSSGS